jgi:hypothetical protein
MGCSTSNHHLVWIIAGDDGGVRAIWSEGGVGGGGAWAGSMGESEKHKMRRKRKIMPTVS